jgi:hypothetical protein
MIREMIHFNLNIPRMLQYIAILLDNCHAKILL